MQMVQRIQQQYGLTPQRLIGDTGYGTAQMLGWIVEQGIEPHVPVWDRSQREDGTLSSSDFSWDEQATEYRCPQGKPLRSQWRTFKIERSHVTQARTIIYRSEQAGLRELSDEAALLPEHPDSQNRPQRARSRS